MTDYEVPQQTVRMEPSDIGQWFCVMKVQGISTAHNVFINEEDSGLYYYIHSPESGPMEWLQKWAHTPTDILVFGESNKTGPFDREFYKRQHAAWIAASKFCLDAATQEIAEEVGI